MSASTKFTLAGKDYPLPKHNTPILHSVFSSIDANDVIKNAELNGKTVKNNISLEIYTYKTGQYFIDFIVFGRKHVLQYFARRDNRARLYFIPGLVLKTHSVLHVKTNGKNHHQYEITVTKEQYTQIFKLIT